MTRTYVSVQKKMANNFLRRHFNEESHYDSALVTDRLIDDLISSFYNLQVNTNFEAGRTSRTYSEYIEDCRRDIKY